MPISESYILQTFITSRILNKVSIMDLPGMQ
uniref:Uncharacterized protein n=1 Tax=Anguilla anguilla TaxID=7936 RepID=A0A0E9R4B1_ANGAN